MDGKSKNYWPFAVIVLAAVSFFTFYYTIVREGITTIEPEDEEISDESFTDDQPIAEETLLEASSTDEMSENGALLE